MKWNRFQKLAFWTIFATYFLILVGGLVRATDSGLGCPDWPQCFGRWIPPTSVDQVPPEIQHQFNFAKAWTEYTNRLIGVVIGLLITATFVLSLVDYRKKIRVWLPSVLAWLGVIFQGWLGAKVVETELHPWVVTIHLVFALIIVIWLLYAFIYSRSEAKVIEFPEKPKIHRLAWLCLLILLLQVALGAWLRGELDVLREDHLHITRENVIEFSQVFFWHRSFSWLIVAVSVGFWAYARRFLQRFSTLQKLVNATLILLLVQVASGIGLSYLNLAPSLQVVHLVISSLWVGILASLILLLGRKQV